MKTILYLLFSGVLVSAQTMTERLQKGLFEEEAKHNLPAAIEEYKAVIAEADEQRRLAATAIFRLAESYRKLGRQNEASEMYERLRRDFSDQADLVRRASGHLPETNRATEIPIPQIRDFTALGQLLKNSPDLLNASYTNGMTLLQHAASKGDIEMIEFLIHPHHGANLEQTTQESTETPLMLAVNRGHKRAAEILLKVGANVHGRGSIGGDTPLKDAAGLGYVEITKLLLEHGADVNLGFRGWTPLHSAARNGHVEIIKLLVEAGANIEAVEVNGQTPLIAAIVGYSGLSARMMPQPQAVLALIEAGANPNNRGRGEEPPIQLAVKSPNWLVFDALMTSPKVDVNAKGSYEMTALMQAIVSKRGDVVQSLLQRKADPNAQSRDGHTALHLAVQTDDLPSIRLLLENGADANLRNSGGQSPLHMAAGKFLSVPSSSVDLEIIELLLKHKADPNQKDELGLTPLRLSVGRGAVQAVQLLLAAEADPNTVGNDGYAPLDAVQQQRNPDLYELLQQAGATNSAKFSSNENFQLAAPEGASFLPKPGINSPGNAQNSPPIRQIPSRRIRPDSAPSSNQPN